MASGKDSNKRRCPNFPGAGLNWHASCLLSSLVSPLGSQSRASRTAFLLAGLLVAALALEIWGIGASVSGFLR
jgi:hypothetical protein